MNRLFNSPELTLPSLDAVLAGIVPTIRKPIIDALIKSGLPLIERSVRQFMWRATPISVDPMFAKYHSGYPGTSYGACFIAFVQNMALEILFATVLKQLTKHFANKHNHLCNWVVDV